MLTLVNHYHYFDLSPYKIEYDKKDFQPNSVYIYIKYRECFFLCRQYLVRNGNVKNSILIILMY